MNGTSPGQLVGLFYERFDDGDLDAVLSLFDVDLETTDPGMGTVYGLEPFGEYIATLKRAVPDARAVVEQVFETSDSVIVEGRFVGTFSGPLATPTAMFRRPGRPWICASQTSRTSATGRSSRTTPTTTSSVSSPSSA